MFPSWEHPLFLCIGVACWLTDRGAGVMPMVGENPLGLKKRLGKRVIAWRYEVFVSDIRKIFKLYS